MTTEEVVRSSDPSGNRWPIFSIQLTQAPDIRLAMCAEMSPPGHQGKRTVRGLTLWYVRAGKPAVRVNQEVLSKAFAARLVGPTDMGGVVTYRLMVPPIVSRDLMLRVTDREVKCMFPFPEHGIMARVTHVSVSDACREPPGMHVKVTCVHTKGSVSNTYHYEQDAHRSVVEELLRITNL
jgi:hypothetical protein